MVKTTNNVFQLRFVGSLQRIQVTEAVEFHFNFQFSIVGLMALTLCRTPENEIQAIRAV